MTRRQREAGQAFPIYITVVAGLLFLAFAYFVVGVSADQRNGAQGAADAAALAAARDARDQIVDELLGPKLPENWAELILGRGFETGAACAIADDYAQKNDSDSTGCHGYYGQYWGFTVGVETKKTIGDSVIPGTADKKGEAQARAVVVPECSLSGAKLDCDGMASLIDPDDLGSVPDLADLFTVRLIDAN
ncbi:pilus assembly protein TadG-related protein [Streptomyces sp. NPDC048479]|uniref:pilus assembly protein TadG-related protein n=1 Tax=Streptomyces sp. NPDC048479 TaxID=3154725 RepID=UPI00342BE441